MFFSSTYLGLVRRKSRVGECWASHLTSQANEIVLFITLYLAGTDHGLNWRTEIRRSPKRPKSHIWNLKRKKTTLRGLMSFHSYFSMAKSSSIRNSSGSQNSPSSKLSAMSREKRLYYDERRVWGVFDGKSDGVVCTQFTT